MKPQLINIALESKRTIQIKKVETFLLDNPLHFHELCELVWIEQGTGKRIIGDSVQNFTSGDLVLMSPNLPHIWQNNTPEDHAEGSMAKATVIYFPADFVLNLTDELAITQPIEHLIGRAGRGLRFYGDTHLKVTSILADISPQDGFKKILSFLQVTDILSGSKEYEYIAGISYRNTHDEKDIKRFSEVYQFLMQNFHREISLLEVAGICHMAPTAFCRFFKSRTGKTFIGFLNEIRIGHACTLLRDENLSIVHTCYKSGYNNLASFNKFFKAIMHKTPTEYRMDCRRV